MRKEPSLMNILKAFKIITFRKTRKNGGKIEEGTRKMETTGSKT